METKPGPASDFAYDVFIRHKSEHKPWVEWLARALQTCGRKVFLDKWNLVPGANWVEGLHRGVDSSRAAVLVATPEVVNSGWVRQEYASLLRRRQANPEFRLIPIASASFRTCPFSPTFKRLISAIRRAIENACTGSSAGWMRASRARTAISFTIFHHRPL